MELVCVVLECGNEGRNNSELRSMPCPMRTHTTTATSHPSQWLGAIFAGLIDPECHPDADLPHPFLSHPLIRLPHRPTHQGRSPPLLCSTTHGNQQNGITVDKRLEPNKGHRTLTIHAQECPLRRPHRRTDESKDESKNPLAFHPCCHTPLAHPRRSYSPYPSSKLVSRIHCQASRTFSIVHLALLGVGWRGIGQRGGETCCFIDILSRIATRSLDKQGGHAYQSLSSSPRTPHCKCSLSRADE
ncbi:hypothetical protein FA13DRAFT_1150006 [Coprinellus micaceus]|uniref:Uncharacterized protein n=1 Tax=Coprinellus micaceus TaxID=71717 RepID=A0A4Y7SWL8_COPMI|nr:hypothetical protein FA13DRAFT_1150006 [Coprinellus micaceus]